MVKQRTRLYGLELESRAVGYGKLNPTHATEIFIREGLVNDTITFPLDFITQNRKVREKSTICSPARATAAITTSTKRRIASTRRGWMWVGCPHPARTSFAKGGVRAPHPHPNR